MNTGTIDGKASVGDLAVSLAMELIHLLFERLTNPARGCIDEFREFDHRVVRTLDRFQSAIRHDPHLTVSASHKN
jgi:hypothetical protein